MATKRPRPYDDDDDDEKTSAKQTVSDSYRALARNEVLPAAQVLQEKASRLRQRAIRSDEISAENARLFHVADAIDDAAIALKDARAVLSGEVKTDADLAELAKQVDAWNLHATVLYHDHATPVTAPAAMRWLVLGTEYTPETSLRRMAQNRLYEPRLLSKIAEMTQAHRIILPGVRAVAMRFEPHTQRLVIVEEFRPANSYQSSERLISCNTDGGDVKRSELLKDYRWRFDVSPGKVHMCDLDTLEITHYALPTLEKLATTKMWPLVHDMMPISAFAVDDTGARMYFAGRRIAEIDVATFEVVDNFVNPLESEVFGMRCALHHLYLVGRAMWTVQRAKPHLAREIDAVPKEVKSIGNTDVYYTPAGNDQYWTAIHEDKDGQFVRQAYQSLSLPRDPTSAFVTSIAASSTHVFVEVASSSDDTRADEIRVFPNLMV